jgi:hypothetical protein
MLPKASSRSLSIPAVFQAPKSPMLRPSGFARLSKIPVSPSPPPLIIITLAPAQRNTQLTDPNPAALPAATALYLTLPRAKYLSGRFINAQWDMEELETHRERIISEDLLKMRVLGIDDHL